jgi:hypothetical protein
MSQKFTVALLSRATAKDEIFAQTIIPKKLKISCVHITSATRTTFDKITNLLHSLFTL